MPRVENLHSQSTDFIVFAEDAFMRSLINVTTKLFNN